MFIDYKPIMKVPLYKFQFGGKTEALINNINFMHTTNEGFNLVFMLA